MIETILAAVAAFIIAIIRFSGYWGIMLLMAIESACIPLPSEIIMPFGGYMVSTGELNLFLVATAGAIGCNLGSIPAYEIGKRGGRVAIERWGRFLLLDVKDLDWAERFFAKMGGPAVLIARMLPIVRSFIAFPAGIARMPLVPFHIYTFVGSWPWCFGLAWVGMVLGDKWNTDPRMHQFFHDFHLAFAAVFVAAGAWYIWHRLKTRVGR
ncbi:DedA family protein [Sphingomonas zeicaulis]|uniref:DedA family protein n=1 Tax=Sphingomonas zeicaulis TaxID=1632740 RepID=UPI003D1ABE38